MNGILRSGLIMLTIASGWVSPVRADIIDFSDGLGFGLTSFTKFIQGTGGAVATANFSNARSEIAQSGGNTDRFYVDGLGLSLGSGSVGYSWDVIFDRTVELTGWDVYTGNGGSFAITGSGVNFTETYPATNPLDPIVFVGLVPALTFLAGQTYNFASPNRCCDGSQSFGGVTFQTWHFNELDAAVPLPSTIALLMLGLSIATCLRVPHDRRSAA